MSQLQVPDSLPSLFHRSVDRKYTYWRLRGKPAPTRTDNVSACIYEPCTATVPASRLACPFTPERRLGNRPTAEARRGARGLFIVVVTAFTAAFALDATAACTPHAIPRKQRPDGSDRSSGVECRTRQQYLADGCTHWLTLPSVRQCTVLVIPNSLTELLKQLHETPQPPVCGFATRGGKPLRMAAARAWATLAASFCSLTWAGDSRGAT
jgi:hypothetical protein